MTFGLADLLTDPAAAPDRIVAWQHGSPVPLAEFAHRVAGLGKSLPAGRRGVLACQDGLYFAIGLYALWHAGCEVLAAPNCLPATLQRLQGEADFLLDDRQIAGTAPADRRPTAFDPATAAVSLFTSGSTGEAKRCRRSLPALEREAALLEALWGKGAGRGPVFATVSPQHLFGLTFRICWPLLAGRAFDSRLHEVWESLLPAMPGDAILITSPAHLGTLTGLAPLAAGPRMVFSAGASLPAQAFDDCRAILGCSPTEIFGSTESGAIATRDRPDGDWRLLPGHRLQPTADDRLCLQSPYDGRLVETADRIEPRGADGFRFLGRQDRIVKIAGKRVSLAEVEMALCAQPLVGAAAALVLPPGGDRLAAVVTLSAEGRRRLEEIGGFRLGRELRQTLAGQLEPAARPKTWRFVDALPDGPLGKTPLSRLQALFAGAVPS